jgi:hypothetical protein
VGGAEVEQRTSSNLPGLAHRMMRRTCDPRDSDAVARARTLLSRAESAAQVYTLKETVLVITR